MTENLYLILHKVRGEPAFDIAIKVEPFFYTDLKGNSEEKIQGEPMWIIPTSGHRAYPSWWKSLEQLGVVMLPDTNFAWGMDNISGTVQGLIPMPYEERDHYPASEPRAAPAVKHVPSKSVTQTEDFVL